MVHLDLRFLVSSPSIEPVLQGGSFICYQEPRTLEELMEVEGLPELVEAACQSVMRQLE